MFLRQIFKSGAVLVALAAIGCAPGPKAIDLKAGETVVLIDVLPRQVFSSTLNLKIVPALKVVPFNTDWGMSEEILDETASMLRTHGYRVEVVRPPASTEHSGVPIPYYGYIGFQYPQWTPQFRSWMRDLLVEHHARTAVVLSTYGRELYNKGPPYTAYGVKTIEGLISNESVFYALVNVNEISIEDTNLSYFVMLHLDNVCERVPPKDIVYRSRNATLTASDVEPYKAVIKGLAIGHIKNELISAKLLSGHVENCPVDNK